MVFAFPVPIAVPVVTNVPTHPQVVLVEISAAVATKPDVPVEPPPLI